MGIDGVDAAKVEAGGNPALIIAGGIAAGIVMVFGAIAFGVFTVLSSKKRRKNTN